MTLAWVADRPGDFCAFESIEAAQILLTVFEKLYRFTPFSDDAQPRI
jgi:hypothetical protein